MTVLCCTNTAGKSWGILIMLKEVQNIPAVRDVAHLHACTWSLKGSGLANSSWYPVAYSLPSSLARWLTPIMSHQTFYSYLKKAIVVLTLLSYTNHVLMPRDVTVCGYFKATCSWVYTWERTQSHLALWLIYCSGPVMQRAGYQQSWKRNIW